MKASHPEHISASILALCRPTYHILAVLLMAVMLASCDAVDPGGVDEADGLTADNEPPVNVGYDFRSDDLVAGKVGDRAHWADGYAWADQPTSASYTPNVSYSFNRAGGGVLITKPAGTIGIYDVRFNNLSPFLGATSTVHVTGYLANSRYCKPKSPRLVNDVIRVFCFDAATKARADSYFSIYISRNYTDMAYAYANSATNSNYAPPGGSSWNPAGTIRVFKTGTGLYQVRFNGLGATMSTGGNIQVNSIGTANKHCKVQGWGGSPDLVVNVGCFTKGGAASNSTFNVIVIEPSPHLAYAWANQPTSASYTPSPFYSSNPGGSITITRSSTGTYNVSFTGFSGHILDGGNAQVTAYGGTNTQCKITGWGSQSVGVRCFAPSGAAADGHFTVFLGS